MHVHAYNKQQVLGEKEKAGHRVTESPSRCDYTETTDNRFTGTGREDCIPEGLRQLSEVLR